MENSVYTIINNGILVNIYLTPGAHKSCITGIVNIDNKTYLRVSVNSKPIENKANLELISVISDYFNIPKSNIEIKRGSKSKYKQIYLNNYDVNKLNNILNKSI
ncbi:MAG: DUF167 domain-containing protein [Alphaproteobacteria bacterium]|nr:DUF167 domain-containing protein [Alphaproteobacteria bacterium]